MMVCLRTDLAEFRYQWCLCFHLQQSKKNEAVSDKERAVKEEETETFSNKKGGNKPKKKLF